ncbi:CIA30 family protein [Aureibaculum marinum]|uniref:CIA30 family protein n=1 Tax=Aureibaculum marinum TaxID=2487930 RepID=A0A3N4P4N9_9FLAO|nr:CIA30 family protein [Aureibaculum marinum]RPD99886.1 CIA30 family protein [Aureibaculum marinum]
MLIFDFNKNSNLSHWLITNDVVMGGQSNGQFTLDNQGNGVFKGEVSLENNGGFSSVKYTFKQKCIEGYTAVVLKVKGDGKEYQVRVKSNSNQRHSYTYKFETTGSWQTLKIPLLEFYPVFRGKKLSLPNFYDTKLAEITFLIANKKKESFGLKISSFSLE